MAVYQSIVYQSAIAQQCLVQQHVYQPSSAQEAVAITEQIVSLAVEAAIAIVINDIHYAVLMASPTQLEYLALGFLFSEGLIEHRHELLDWQISPFNTIDMDNRYEAEGETICETDSLDVDGNQQYSNKKQTLQHLQDYDVFQMALKLTNRRQQRIQAQKRQLAGRTGCGMCGITGLTQALPNFMPYSKQQLPQPSLTDLLALRRQVTDAQQAHKATGAVHAAATIYDGKLYVFEDVGRHNALDKLIGWQLRNDITLHYVLMTSRLSIELVQKCIRMQLPWLIGMSAPTSTAVKVAQRYGLGLGGFLRDNRVTFYTGYEDACHSIVTN